MHQVEGSLGTSASQPSTNSTQVRQPVPNRPARPYQLGLALPPAGHILTDSSIASQHRPAPSVSRKCPDRRPTSASSVLRSFSSLSASPMHPSIYCLAGEAGRQGDSVRGTLLRGAVGGRMGKNMREVRNGFCEEQPASALARPRGSALEAACAATRSGGGMGAKVWRGREVCWQVCAAQNQYKPAPCSPGRKTEGQRDACGLPPKNCAQPPHKAALPSPQE